MKIFFIALVAFFTVLLSEDSIAGTYLGFPEASEVEHLEEIAQTIDFWQRADSLKSGSPKVWKVACCKVCRKGKACGNSCISKSYTCRKGPGCACDG